MKEHVKEHGIIAEGHLVAVKLHVNCEQLCICVQMTLSSKNLAALAALVQGWQATKGRRVFKGGR